MGGREAKVLVREIGMDKGCEDMIPLCDVCHWKGFAWYCFRFLGVGG